MMPPWQHNEWDDNKSSDDECPDLIDRQIIDESDSDTDGEDDLVGSDPYLNNLTVEDKTDSDIPRRDRLQAITATTTTLRDDINKETKVQATTIQVATVQVPLQKDTTNAEITHAPARKDIGTV